VPPEQHRDVRAARQAAQRAAGKLAAAAAAAAAVPAPARPPKANTTDVASRVMPGKKGGYGQHYNLQALACRGQICLAAGFHDSPNDVAALHPLLDAGAANLAAAGIPATIGKALFDTGYASDANFTASCDADLHVAVTREARQTRKSGRGKDPAAKDSWQQMAAKLGTPEGQAAYRQRKAIIEPLFAQLFARFGRTLNYRGDMAATEVHLWAAVHNMLKAIRARTHREHLAAARPALAAA
jgi:Transposase DDE domain